MKTEEYKKLELCILRGFFGLGSGFGSGAKNRELATRNFFSDNCPALLAQLGRLTLIGRPLFSLATDLYSC